MTIENPSPNKEVRLENRAFLALWLGSFFLMLFSTSRAWIATTAALTVIFGVAYWWAHQLADYVSVTRKRRYGWAQVGDLLEEQFILTNRALVPALWIEIEDHSTLPGYHASRVVAAGGGETLQWRVEGVCQQRGVFNLGPWLVRLSDPFGLYRIQIPFPDVTNFMVYPPVAHLPGIELPRGYAPGTARRHERALADTTDAGGVRPFMPGDALRRVHWPTTAHRQELYVKEFDLEPSGDLWILLDLDAAVQAGKSADSTEETGVTIAASLTHAALLENRAVGLAISGEVPILLEPHKGRNQLWQVLRALAQAQAGEGPTLAELLRRVRANIAHGLTVAIITPACTPDWPVELLALQRRGVAVTAILLDPASFGGTGDVAGMQSFLAELGIGCQIIQRGMPLPPVFKVERQGRPEYRVGATGRLIPVNGHQEKS